MGNQDLINVGPYMAGCASCSGGLTHGSGPVSPTVEFRQFHGRMCHSFQWRTPGVGRNGTGLLHDVFVQGRVVRQISRGFQSVFRYYVNRGFLRKANG